MAAEKPNPAIAAIVNSIDKPGFQTDFLGQNVPNAERFVRLKLNELTPFDHVITGIRIIQGLSSRIHQEDKQEEIRQKTAIGVFSMLDFAGMEPFDLGSMQDNYLQAVRKQSEIRTSERTTNALFNIGTILMPQLYDLDNPEDLMTNMREAWAPVIVSAPPETRKALLERTERIIDCFGLSRIEPAETDFFTHLYSQNPEITPEEVQTAINATDTITEPTKDLLLVFLYRNHPRNSIVNTIDRSLSKVLRLQNKLIELKLIERLKQGGKIPNTERDDWIVRLINYGLNRTEIALLFEITTAVVTTVWNKNKDRITVPKERRVLRDLELEAAVVTLINNGKRRSEIAPLLGVKPSRVTSIHNRYKDKITAPRIMGRPRNRLE